MKRGFAALGGREWQNFIHHGVTECTEIYFGQYHEVVETLLIAAVSRQSINTLSQCSL